ncbi:hypothetical protein CY34DRAFT_806714 [Suillus luteus UH-Slu-Lm8-n1]|uniref:Uncharacterized protein n=1 Tax=Suillus luteus UH-Slu-Lm8-n1 TaxID=930992 RepID=A0A0D0AGP0_9AGAM|nr:hypothetical protein CY34DRAFT_806714 [Suillus luteus UH-Slu-Lm8-n1]
MVIVQISSNLKQSGSSGHCDWFTITCTKPGFATSIKITGDQSGTRQSLPCQGLNH